MVFSRNKEKLWRYASENMQFAPNADGTNNQPQQPHRLQPQRLPQQQPHLIQQSTQSYENCCLNSSSSPLVIRPSISSQHSHQQSNTPLPPYSSVPCGMDCSGSSEVHADYLMSFRQQSTYTTETEVSATESEDRAVVNYKITGCDYENYGDNMSVDICEQFDNSNYYQLSQKLQEQQQQIVRRPTLTSQTSAAITSTVTTIATTASNLVRNCCGGVFSSQSRIDITCPNNNNTSNNTMKNRYEQRQRMGTLTKKSALISMKTAKQYFNALLKNMKSKQISALLTAVRSRRSDQSILTSAARNRLAVHQQCILVKRGLIIDEEPFVVVCALFLWQDLRDASELKRLPVCPTECDPVYVCCNPLHWFRITETLETAPPPYQPQLLERLNPQDCVIDENSQNGKNLFNTSTGSTVSNIKMQPELRVRIPDSLTTDGEDQNACPLVWCQVAYWELSQRVGERYLAKKSSVNIYSDDPCQSDSNDDMCLKELAKQKRAPSPEFVNKTRLKIGLGVTLSKENGNIWLYNRSMIPIFVNSPTLSENWHCVCKILPGYCLKAFDSERAQTLKYPSHFPGAQLGPKDPYGMQISFGKGWGNKYKRQDIISCPCWFEVLLPTQR